MKNLTRQQTIELVDIMVDINLTQDCESHYMSNGFYLRLFKKILVRVTWFNGVTLVVRIMGHGTWTTAENKAFLQWLRFQITHRTFKMKIKK
jgi:hypothetical protein